MASSIRDVGGLFGYKKKRSRRNETFYTQKSQNNFFFYFITKPFVGSKTSYMVELAKGQTIFSWILIMAYNNA
jgi:hypothetical protein